MRASDYIVDPESLLDVGCNVGAWLADCHRHWPAAKLAGVEPNAESLAQARQRLPDADLRVAGAEALPFADASFHYVTCFEVLEHVPAELRRQALGEIRRVLHPGGRLVLTVPHRGWFAWLDSNNVRFQLPAVYTLLVKRGLRDASYEGRGRHVEWHHHFTLDEFRELAGDGWREVSVSRGGLLLPPLTDWLSWPFYRSGRVNHPVRRALERLSEWDSGHDYGPASYGMLVALERAR
jgi:SAM-dependent methyltransferase